MSWSCLFALGLVTLTKTVSESEPSGLDDEDTSVRPPRFQLKSTGSRSSSVSSGLEYVNDPPTTDSEDSLMQNPTKGDSEDRGGPGNPSQHRSSTLEESGNEQSQYAVQRWVQSSESGSDLVELEEAEVRKPAK